MGGRQFVVIAEGRRHRLGWTDSYAGIWRRRLRGWHLLATYPLGDEGLRAAQQHFARLEPSAVYVNLASGTPLPETVGSRWPVAAVAAVIVAGAVAAAVLILRSGHLGVHAGAAPTSSTTTVASAPPGGGWVADSPEEVDYLQWTTAGGSLQGSLGKVRITGQVPNQRSVSTEDAITGSVDGPRVKLVVNGSTAVYASLSGSGLTVNWPSAGGTVTAQVFAPVAAGGYDQSVAALISGAVGANASGGGSGCAAGASCLPVPPPPAGYEEIGRISSSQGSKHVRVHFAARPLQLCYAVSDPSIQRLTYQIGHSWFGFGGPTTMFSASGGNSVTNGCRSDPGNDSGGQTVAFHVDRAGSYTVAIYQAVP